MIPIVFPGLLILVHISKSCIVIAHRLRSGHIPIHTYVPLKKEGNVIRFVSSIHNGL